MARPWSAVRTPAFWFLAGVTAPALLAIALFAAVLTWFAPVSALVTAPALAAYAVLWIVLLLRWADPVERRPWWAVVLAFGWGASVACVVGAGSGYYLDEMVARGVSPTFAAVWGAALEAPTAEEPAKLAGVVLLVLAARPYLTTAWSGAIYGALVGVGFAVTEDVGYVLGAADEALPDDVGAATRVLALRFLVPGFAGHPLFTATAGAGIVYAWLRADRSRWWRFGVGAGAVAVAWLMHAAVNSPVAATAADKLDDVAGFGVLTGYFLVVGVPAAVAFGWLAVLRRHDAAVVLRRAGRVDPGAIRPDEIGPLAGPRRWDRGGGDPAARQLRQAGLRLRRAQLRLAAVVNRPFRGYPPAAPPNWYAPPVAHWRQEVYAARQALAGSMAVAAPVTALDQAVVVRTGPDMAANLPALAPETAPSPWAAQPAGPDRAPDPPAVGPEVAPPHPWGAPVAAPDIQPPSGAVPAAGPRPQVVDAAGPVAVAADGRTWVEETRAGPVVAARPSRWLALLLVLLAIGGLAFWPVGAVAAGAAAGTGWWLRRTARRPDALLRAGVAAGLFGGYVWLTSGIVALLYPA